MQSLISPVDHESRTSSYRGGDSIDRGSSEESPLIYRFPRQNNTSNLTTILVVSILLIILVGGFGIGVYLLVAQDNADNVLPPVEVFQYVPRSQWATTNYPTALQATAAQSVVIQQTDTEQCADGQSCVEILRHIEVSLGGNRTLPYNFMVASDGTIYEGLGWSRLSPLYPQLSALVLAFIGNYTTQAPSKEQVASAKRFIEVSVEKKYLVTNYTVIGKTTRVLLPQYLFQNFESLPEWDEGLSDY